MNYMNNSDFDFTEKNFMTPEMIICEICKELSEATKEYVQGSVSKYEGEIESYDRLSIAEVMSNITATTKVNIQNKLGEIGNSEFKYEFYLTSKHIENFKYRVMFIEYGIGGYPVKLVVEQGIADEIRNQEYTDYIFICNTKEEFETIVVGIMNSKKMNKIIQDLITASIRKLKLLGN